METLPWDVAAGWAWLWRASWQAAVLAVLVLGVQALLGRRLSAAWRYRLWLLVVVRLVLPVQPASSLSLFNLVGVPGMRPAVPAAAAGPVSGGDPGRGQVTMVAPGLSGAAGVREAIGVPDPVAGAGAPLDSGRDAASGAADRPAGVSSPGATLAATSSWRAWWGMPGWGVGLVAVWWTGVVVLGGRWVGQNVRFARDLRRDGRVVSARVEALLGECRAVMGVRRAVTLRETALVTSPALFGVRRPVLLLPTGLADRFTDAELRWVLLHELAHVRRGDLPVQWLISWLRVVHWFNPVLWLAFRRMEADRELATDARVLTVAGDGESQAYGAMILKLLEGWTRPGGVAPAVGILEDRLVMRTRIRRIAAFRRPSRASAWAVVPMAALAVATLTDAETPATVKEEGGFVPGDFAAAAGRSPDSAAGEFHPVPLQAFCTRTYEVIDQDPDSSWAYAPHGRHVFNGVLFDLPGVMEVSGLGAARDANPLPTSIRDIPLGRKARRLHLLHGGAADLREGTPLAKLVLHYVDGREHTLPLVYGHNVRNWYKGGDKRDDVTDPNTRLAWTGDSPRSRRFGSTLRIYHTAFDLPWPDVALRSVDFVSLLSESVSVIPGMTLESGEGGGAGEVATRGGMDSAGPGSTEVRVRVVDDASGAPIPEATVRLRLWDDRQDFRFGEQRATAGGEIVLDVLNDGPSNRTVQVRAPGYLGTTVRLPTPLVGGREMELRLTTGTRIGGRVVDEAGRPVNGASVRIHGVLRDASGQEVEAELDLVVSDEDGRWATGSVASPLRRLRFEVKEANHLPLDVRLVEDGEGAAGRPTADRLLAGEARFVLLAPPEVTGRVLSGTTGAPVAGAEVVVASGPDFVNRRSARTDERGRFALSVADLGHARLVVQAPGHAPDLTSFLLERPTPPLEARLAAPRLLQGKVVDANGHGVPGASLYVVQWMGVNLLTWRVETDAEGRFRWDHAPRESFVLAADKAGYPRVFERIEPVFPGGSDPEVILTLGARLAFRGRVVEAATGAPVSAFQVMVAADLGMPTTSLAWERPEGLSLSAGAFGFSGDFSRPWFAGADIRVLVTSPGYQPQVSPAFSHTGTHAFVFRMEKAAAIAGMVQGADGRPAAGAQIAATGVHLVHIGKEGLEVVGADNEAGAVTRAGTDGRFTVEGVLPGSRLVMHHPDAGYAETTVDAVAETGRVVLQPWGRIEGRLRIGTRPGTNEWVSLLSEFAGAWPRLQLAFGDYRAETDAQEGRFVFDRVPPGERHLVRLVWSGPGTYAHSHRLTVTVRPGEVTRVEWGGTGRVVTGRLTARAPGKWDWTGRGHRSLSSRLPKPPIPSTLDARVWNASVEGRAWLNRELRQYSPVMEADGRFRFEDVPPGTYDLQMMFTSTEIEPGAPARYRGSVHRQVEVPEVGPGERDTPLDLGEIPMVETPPR